jgi:predicted enzyme related to lactoylglutathione lyase
MRVLRALLVLTTLALLSCTAMDINVPAISDEADSAHLPGKVVWHELLTDTPEQSLTFYSELFGWEFESLADTRLNYMTIRHQGVLIGGMIDQTRLPNKVDISQWVTLIAVADVERAAAAVESGGGTVFTPPTSLGERGDIAVVADDQGALFALLQTTTGEPLDNDKGEVPAVGDFLWDELWTVDIAAAGNFYSALAPYQAEVKTPGRGEDAIDYNVLSSQGRMRMGIRDNPVEGLPPIWVNYLRVADAGQLGRILERVEPLGGEILMPAVERPGGGSMAIIAGPSGAGIALQVWPEDGEPGMPEGES